MVEPIKLSFSATETYAACGKKYHFQYVQRLRPKLEAANLAFGRAIDEATSAYLTAVHDGTTCAPPADIFRASWDASVAKGVKMTNKQLTTATLGAIGEKMMSRFPEFWSGTGLQVATLPDGKPALQVRLSHNIGEGVMYTGVLDIMAFDRDCRLGISDEKTTGARTPEDFEKISGQLTDYQMLAQRNAAYLGIAPGDIEWLNFTELKKTKDPVLTLLPQAQPRSAEAVEERLSAIRRIADSIRRGHFERNSGSAYNSPCTLCTFRLACLRSDYSEFELPATMKQLSAGDIPDFDLEDLDEAA